MNEMIKQAENAGCTLVSEKTEAKVCAGMRSLWATRKNGVSAMAKNRHLLTW